MRKVPTYCRVYSQLSQIEQCRLLQNEARSRKKQVHVFYCSQFFLHCVEFFSKILCILCVLQNVHPAVSGFRVKEERTDDAEINALAAKMVEQNKAKMAQAQAAANATGQLSGQRTAGQAQITSYMNRGGNQAGQRVPPTNGPASNDEKPPIDIMSQKGKVHWVGKAAFT